MPHKDVSESTVLKYSNQLLSILLKDRTTGKNITWASSDYSELGESYETESEIRLFSDRLPGFIKPRSSKAKESQLNRTRKKAEVFTPSWMCNNQNNLIDEQWFGRANVFNESMNHKWKTRKDKIEFPIEKNKDWRSYVDARRMEITCGEAPYLVSRYDTVTGKYICIIDRIGLLDRKLRVVNENTDTESEWLHWVNRAYQSIYGYEYQVDNLLLARLNLIYTFVDYYMFKFDKVPELSNLKKIATIISWNLWQMDGTTYSVPTCDVAKKAYQISFFDDEFISESTNETQQLCKIKDWRSKSIIVYKTLMEE